LRQIKGWDDIAWVMRRLMDVIASGRLDLKPMVTHRFKLDQIEDAYELYSHQRDGVLKVAITT
jgi:alcohol dehydrogenase